MLAIAQVSVSVRLTLGACESLCALSLPVDAKAGGAAAPMSAPIMVQPYGAEWYRE